MGFEVPQMGLESTADKNNGNVHQHSQMGHQGGPVPQSHPTGTQTLQRRPHTPHTPHLGHSHSSAVSSQGGNPHGHGPQHGHLQSQMSSHSDQDVPDKKPTSKPEIDRKTKGNVSNIC